jgi:hypothetical protein
MANPQRRPAISENTLRRVWSREEVGPSGVVGAWFVHDTLPSVVPVSREEIDIFEAYFGDRIDELLFANR